MWVGLTSTQANILRGNHASPAIQDEDGTIFEMDEATERLMAVDDDGQPEWQDEEAEVYLGALHDTARSPYVSFVFSCFKLIKYLLL